MELRLTKYRMKYYNQCINLMGDIWNSNKLFPGLRVNNLINKLFFSSLIDDSNYSQMILGNEDKVHGYILGKITNKFTSSFITF